MEHLELQINDIDGFDAVMKSSLPDTGDLKIITKDAGTEGGRGIVMFTFTVQLPDGTLARAQTVTSMRSFRAIASAVAATYNDDGHRVNMSDPLDDGVITGETL